MEKTQNFWNDTKFDLVKNVWGCFSLTQTIFSQMDRDFSHIYNELLFLQTKVKNFMVQKYIFFSFYISGNVVNISNPFQVVPVELGWE